MDLKYLYSKISRMSMPSAGALRPKEIASPVLFTMRQRLA
jgi:hypothetical protein